MTDRPRYDPLSRFHGLGADVVARIDGGEFPGHIDPLLAAEIDVLERRHASLFVVYEPKTASSGDQLCRHARPVGLSEDAIADVRRIERAFDVWLVAYHRPLSRDPAPGSP